MQKRKNYKSSSKIKLINYQLLMEFFVPNAPAIKHTMSNAKQDPQMRHQRYSTHVSIALLNGTKIDDDIVYDR